MPEAAQDGEEKYDEGENGFGYQIPRGFTIRWVLNRS
jgi:hypothetical protein